MRCSEDLRRRVIRAVEQGASRQQVAERFGICTRSIYRWQKKLQADKPGPKAAHKVDMCALLRDVEANRDALLVERAERLGVTPQAVWYALRRLDITKKNVAVC